MLLSHYKLPHLFDMDRRGENVCCGLLLWFESKCFDALPCGPTALHFLACPPTTTTSTHCSCLSDHLVYSLHAEWKWLMERKGPLFPQGQGLHFILVQCESTVENHLQVPDTTLESHVAAPVKPQGFLAFII